MSILKQSIQALGTWKFWKELVIMTVGMMVTAAAVYYFLVPSKLVIGTISGLSIVLSSVFGFVGLNIKVSTLILIINVILLIMAYLLIDHEFGIKTVYTALVLGPLMDLWDVIYPYTNFLTEPGQTSVMGEIWFDLLAFVLLLGASQAIMFSINASTGGLDILAKIVNKYLHFDIGASVSVAGFVICATAFAINSFQMVIIGMIGTWINGLIVDYFTAGLNRKKRVCIITPDYLRVKDYIVKNIQRSCSLYDVTGGVSGDKYVEIQCILTNDEFVALMEYLRRSEIHHFVTAGNVSEIYGSWSQHKKLIS